jgi:hypothetical protein
MLDALETLMVGAALGTVLTTITTSARASTLGRIIFGAVAGAWIGLVAVATTVHFGNSPFVLPLMFSTPLVAVGLLNALWPRFRAALAGIPSTSIIASNVFRLIGLFFLVLLAEGRLSGPFPYFAGIGDIITGLFALPVARFAERAPLNHPRILIWNAFGMLDLLNAVVMGVLSQPGPTQLLHVGVGSAAIATLPWSMIPLALVPTYLLGHVVIFARALRAQQENAVTT